MTHSSSQYAFALRCYLRELARHQWLSLPALLAPALGNICQRYLPPLVVAGLINRVAATGESSPTFLLWRVGAFAGLLLAAELLWRAGLHCLNRVECYAIEHLLTMAMDEMLARDTAFFQTQFSGSLTKQALSFATRFEIFTDTLAAEVIAALVPMVFACVILGSYDPYLVVVLVGMLLLAGLVVAPLIRRRQALVHAREEAAASVSGHVADIVGNMPVVRAFGAEATEAAEHRRRVGAHGRKALLSWDYSNQRIDVAVIPLVVLTNAAGLVIALTLRGGHASVAVIMVTFTYFFNATLVMFRFNMIYRQIESALTEAAQFARVILTPPTVLDPPQPEPLQPEGFGIRFDKVNFAHKGTTPLFRDLELIVPDGTTMGLVGRSGGGKSTVTQLLLRMMDVDGGCIRIGGQDISRVRQADLRRMIGYVPQEPAMFHRSLADNIRFARPEAADHEVLRAAEAAHVTEFMNALPQGMDTVIGERGVKLSGGQRQRVALARAILRDAPILILDEATSALDSDSETLVQEALWNLMVGRTALVIAHRLSTVAGLDQLVVLDHGRIVEQGTHVDLLDAGGAYAHLWRRQSGGFLDERVPTR